MKTLSVAKLDQKIYNAIDAYRSKVAAAQRECQVATATAGAIEARVAVLDLQAENAEASAANATDNFAAARATSHALKASQDLAYASLGHALQAEQSVTATYTTLHQLAELLVQGVLLAESLETAVDRAVSKNGMPSFVAAAAKSTADAARAASAASLTALADSANAMAAAGQALTATAALPAGLQRLKIGMQGYTQNANSDLIGIPGTLELALPEHIALDVGADGPAKVVKDVRDEIESGSSPAPPVATTSLSFAMQSHGFIPALRAFTAALQEADGETPDESSSFLRQGLLAGFYQLFQVFGQTKQMLLDVKTTAHSHLIEARQALEATTTASQYATEALTAAEQADLT